MLQHTLPFKLYHHCTIWMRRFGDTELFVVLRVFCNPETQFSQRRARAGTQSGDCGHTVVTLLSLHAQSLCCATQSGRGRTQSGFWRWFSATQSGFTVTVRELTVNLCHTVRGLSAPHSPTVSAHSALQHDQARRHVASCRPSPHL